MKFKQPVSEDRAEMRRRTKLGLMNKTDQQIDSWIDANVTNLASAKNVLAELVKNQRDILRYLAKHRG